MSRAQVRARRQQAADWLKNMQLVDEMHDAVDIARPNNQVVSAAIFAGIAAADAICGHHLGERSSGADHAAAAQLLETAGPNGKSLALDLRRLINEKTNANYGDAEISDTKAQSLVRAAERLVRALDQELSV